MIKSLTSLFILFFVFSPAFSQDSDANAGTRDFYLGLSTGINNYSGLIGVTAEYHFVKPLSAYGALGIGSWGSKTSIGLRFYPHYPDQWSVNLSYSHCSGIDDMKVDMEEDFVKDQSGKQKIEIDLKPINTVNLSATKHWLIGKRKINRIHLELGYAIPTSTEQYETTAELTSKGKTFMRMLEPGGIIVGTGISFGL